MKKMTIIKTRSSSLLAAELMDFAFIVTGVLICFNFNVHLSKFEFFILHCQFLSFMKTTHKQYNTHSTTWHREIHNTIYDNHNRWVLPLIVAAHIWFNLIYLIYLSCCCFVFMHGLWCFPALSRNKVLTSKKSSTICWFLPYLVLYCYCYSLLPSTNKSLNSTKSNPIGDRISILETWISFFLHVWKNEKFFENLKINQREDKINRIQSSFACFINEILDSRILNFRTLNVRILFLTLEFPQSSKI